MTVTHVGSNGKYASGWDAVFSKGGKKKPAAAGKLPAKSTKKKPAKKQAKK